jgi:hypothetical protein
MRLSFSGAATGTPTAMRQRAPSLNLVHIGFAANESKQITEDDIRKTPILED